MDTLDNTDWDVVIAGTGLQQSLLALYVLAFHGDLFRNLTDVVLEELCRARARTYCMWTKIRITAGLLLPSVCRKRRSGRPG